MYLCESQGEKEKYKSVFLFQVLEILQSNTGRWNFIINGFETKRDNLFNAGNKSITSQKEKLKYKKLFPGIFSFYFKPPAKIVDCLKQTDLVLANKREEGILAFIY